jgi:hypothetical protein
VQVLNNKTILVLSPQSWGKMFVSKHHFAVELANKGNQVFFLNPPDSTFDNDVQVTADAETAGLFIISHRLSFAYNIKFHAIGVFHWLMKWHIKKILRTIGKPIDIVWSFDLGNLYPFKLFPKTALRIFHPVDEPLNKAALYSAKGAQVIFSVTQEILDKYKQLGVPCHFINHGVSESFFKQVDVFKTSDRKRVGFSGNLLRPDIDRPILIQIIKENLDVVFDFFGSYQKADSNIGGEVDSETALFISELKCYSNVVLHGVICSKALSDAYGKVDAFLICYDVKKDQSKGTNYHKIMEFISTGKVIISNNVSTYQKMPHLVTMVDERDNNSGLPFLFKKTITSVSENNSESMIALRKAFAREHIYSNQINKIENLL